MLKVKNISINSNKKASPLRPLACFNPGQVPSKCEFSSLEAPRLVCGWQVLHARTPPSLAGYASASSRLFLRNNLPLFSGASPHPGSIPFSPFFAFSPSSHRPRPRVAVAQTASQKLGDPKRALTRRGPMARQAES